jgi:hypothetical protein
MEEVLKETAKYIREFPEYEEVYDIARTNCQGILPEGQLYVERSRPAARILLVGGRAYRALAECLYGDANDETAFGIHGTDPFGSRDCDWDFLASGFVGKGATTPDKWCYTVRDEYSSYAATPYKIKKDSSLVRWRKTEFRRDHHYVSSKEKEDELLCKIDLININRIVYQNKNIKNHWYQFWKKDPPEATLDDYFTSVPLNIQAIAFDPIAGIFYGDGIKAILDKEIRCNNIASLKEAARREHCEPIDILRRKARSMPGFNCSSQTKHNHQLNATIS